MIHIDHLRMHMPRGWEDRAFDIVQLTGKLLSDYSFSHNETIEKLTLPKIVIHPSFSNKDIATIVSGHIINSLNRKNTKTKERR